MFCCAPFVHFLRRVWVDGAQRRWGMLSISSVASTSSQYQCGSFALFSLLPTSTFFALYSSPNSKLETLSYRQHFPIRPNPFGNTGSEALVMGERRGRYGCKDCLYRVEGLWAIGVRSWFAAQKVPDCGAYPLRTRQGSQGCRLPPRSFCVIFNRAYSSSVWRWNSRKYNKLSFC